MAVKGKKSEAIHLRVSADSKGHLEVLANATGKNSTQTVENLLVQAVESVKILEMDFAVDDRLWSGGDWTLLKAFQLANVAEDPMLRKLRMYFLAEEGLSPKDRFVCFAILWSAGIFSGSTAIFQKSENVITNPDKHRIFSVDLDSIGSKRSSLEDYAEFRLKNKLVSPSYMEFLRMIEEDTSRQTLERFKKRES
ncbi:hypothetical protein [Pseudomonas abieticivorans]|uniref:hypothetical protein n=1 Tax=Pseudomonas abieticivorans TaxID=2931382 RepID=UPI0020C05912|nr:hypothetical protein [Pseudomonas sp. PIA16]